jgi:hypothetical protein
MGMRLLVFGGRNFDDWELVFETLDELGPYLVIHGGAGRLRKTPQASRGADVLAGIWCDQNLVPCIEMRAPWIGADLSGTRGAAGPIRNSWMIEYGKPDFAVGFPGGKGTADMRRRCIEAGIEGKMVTR